MQQYEPPLEVLDPKSLLPYAKKLLESAKSEADYRLVVEKAYYSAYHLSTIFEERLPERSVASGMGSHDSLLNRLERPAPNLVTSLRNTSKFIGKELRAFKVLREIATYKLEKNVSIRDAETAILTAEDIVDECERGLKEIQTLASN